MAHNFFFISHTADHGTFRVGSHHLARELSLLGHQVTHVSTPYTPVHRLLNRGQGPRRELAGRPPSRDEAGVTHFVPRLPLPVRALEQKHALSRQLTAVGLAKADFLIVDQPLMSGVLQRRPGQHVIYRPTDLYPAGAGARRQHKVVGFADAVVATSRHVLEHLPEIKVPAMVLENGVEFSRFALAQPAHRSGFLYVGAMDHRFDWDAVRRIAVSWPHQPVRLVGPAPVRMPALPGNVVVHGSAAYTRLPEIMNSSLVGLMPFNNAAENAGRSPMKLFEYVAAGLPVVGREISSLIGHPGAEKYLFLYQDAAGLDRAVRGALDAAPLELGARDAAQERDWSLKAVQLLDFLENVRPRDGGSR